MKELEGHFWDSLEVIEDQHWITQSFQGRGDMNFSGNLRFSGQWTGLVQSSGEEAHLYVMSEGKIKGQIKVKRLSVEGELEDVQIEAEVFRALPGARVRGQITAQILVVEEGAIVEGRIVSAPAKQLATAAKKKP